MSTYRAALARQDNQTSETTNSQISRMMRDRGLVCPARGLGALQGGADASRR
jgi:hypothetical protein